MSYIYDILLNFQKNYYDFFEWNSTDEIIHIRKMPVFRVNNLDYKKIKNSIVKFESEFLDKIYNRTEKFKNINISFLNYVFLISNGKEAMGIKLNKDGFITHKSSLLLDEEEDIAETAEDLEIYKLNYKFIKSENSCLHTRNERENIANASNKLFALYSHKEDEKLKFLYLECFGKNESDVDKIYKVLASEIKNNNKNTSKIIDFFKLISQK